MHEGNSKFSLTALAVSLNLRQKQSTGKISLWERVRGTFVRARIVTQGWVVVVMNVAQNLDNKEKVQLSFSAYRTSRKHLYSFRRDFKFANQRLYQREYTSAGWHTRNSARDCSRVSFCSTQLLSFKKQLTHSILVKLNGNGAFKFRAAYNIWVEKKNIRPSWLFA